VSELDPVIHQPTRLRLVMLLSGVDMVDFNFLLNTLSLTKGNLSSHMNQLEEVGYVEISKTFNGKIPHTSYRITRLGRSRLEEYWQVIDDIRQSAKTPAKTP